MAVEPMEEVIEESGLEASGDEESLVKFLRGQNISPKEVKTRLEAYVNRPATPPSAPAPEPKQHTATLAQVRTMLAEHGKKVEEGQRVGEVQRALRATIGTIVDDSKLTKRSKRRERVVDDVLQTLCARDDVAKLSDDEFQKVLLKETNQAIADEREDDGTPPPVEPKDEGRKTAAETMGQTNGNEPPPKSAVQTEQPPRGNRVTARNVDEAFGAADRNWNLTDGELEQESSREAESALRKARGG